MDAVEAQASRPMIEVRAAQQKVFLWGQACRQAPDMQCDCHVDERQGSERGI